MTASRAASVPAVETLANSISIFSDLLYIGNDPGTEWICGDDNFDNELQDKLLCQAIWGGPQCGPPRMTHPGGPCQIPGCSHDRPDVSSMAGFAMNTACDCKRLDSP